MSASVSIASPVYSDRHALLAHGVNQGTDRGVEFGALDWPVFKSNEADVKFVDFTSTEELRRVSYAANPQNIVDVDYIWTGAGSLADVVGQRECFDFAIASHVIEHIPNVLGWFRGIHAVLKPGGRFNLAIPDKRFTFDVGRKETTIAEMVEADLLDLHAPNLRQVFDHVYLGRQIDPGAVWRDERDVKSFAPMAGTNALQTALEMATSVHKHGSYYDTHCSVFTPASFLSILEEATRLRLFSFYVDRFIITGPGGEGASGFEFFANLIRPPADMGTEHRLVERISQVREEVRLLNRNFSLLA